MEIIGETYVKFPGGEVLLGSSDYSSVPAGYSYLPASLLSALAGSGVQNDRPDL